MSCVVSFCHRDSHRVTRNPTVFRLCNSKASTQLQHAYGQTSATAQPYSAAVQLQTNCHSPRPAAGDASLPQAVTASHGRVLLHTQLAQLHGPCVRHSQGPDHAVHYQSNMLKLCRRCAHCRYIVL